MLKKMLILLGLASCNVLPVDDGEIRISVDRKRSTVQLESIENTSLGQDVKSPENVNIDTGIKTSSESMNDTEVVSDVSQESLNQLWIKNLQSQEYYFPIWNDKKWEYKRVNIGDNRYFKIIGSGRDDTYKLVKVINNLNAIYEKYSVFHGVRKITYYYIVKMRIQDEHDRFRIPGYKSAVRESYPTDLSYSKYLENEVEDDLIFEDEKEVILFYTKS